VSTQRQRVVTRRLVVLAGVAWTFLWALAIALVLKSGRPWFDEAVTTILPVLFAGYAVLVKCWPRSSKAPQGRAVAQVRVGHTVVGTAFRTRGRLMVTSIRVVNEALGRDLHEMTAPSGRSRIDLLFPSAAGAGEDDRISARVVEWGPARRDLRHNEVVVLRTVERLPRRIPSLRIAAHSHKGPVIIVLPDAGCSAGGPDPAVLAAEIKDHQVVASSAGVIALPTGAPVLSVETDDADVTGEVVALLGADRTPDAHSPDPGSEPLPRLVEADDMRPLVQSISRRELFRVAALTGGAVVALGGISSLVGANGEPTAGPTALKLKGAGWAELFKNDAVRDYLHRQGFDIDADVTKMSGVQSLRPGMDLSGYDFMTAPNLVIADELVARSDVRFQGVSPQQICIEDMVVVASRQAADGLSRTGRLVLPTGGTEYFDVLGYLQDRKAGTTWGAIGVTDPDNDSGGQVRVACSNPRTAGGGQMFLWLLAEVAREGKLLPEQWLWESGGPLYGWTKSATLQLFTDLENGSEQMAFVYEHDAIDFLLKEPDRVGEFVILRTFPNMRLNQMLLAKNDDFAELFANPTPEFAQILVREFHIRVHGEEKSIDRFLEESLPGALWSSGGRARPVPSRPRKVVVDLGDVKRLLARLESYEITGRS
jgi:hypothetical protein